MKLRTSVYWTLMGYLLLLLSPAPSIARPQPAPPNAPSNFAGEALSSESARWTWNPVLGSSTTLEATSYEVHDENHVALGTVPGPGSGSLEFIESGLSPGTYTRHVHASNAGLVSGPSNPASVTLVGPPPDVPCTVSPQGAKVVLVGQSADVYFTATPGDGRFDFGSVKVTGPKNIEPKILDGSPVRLRVRVKGLKKSKKIDDSTFEVAYICKDGERKKANWSMTVVDREDSRTALTVVAVPPGPETVGVGATDEFDFRAFAPVTATSTTTFTSVAAFGDDTGLNAGYITASAVDGVPQQTDVITVNAEGVHKSRKMDDVSVVGSAEATFMIDGATLTAMGDGRKQFTVGPLRDHHDACPWSIVGPEGVARPEKEKPPEVVHLEFKATPEGTGKLKWRSVLTPAPSVGITAHVVRGMNTANMTVQVTVRSAAAPSILSGDTLVTVEYECEKDGIFEFGVATHAMTVYRLTKKE